MTTPPRTSPQVAHESETQRQHPRFSLPASATLDGRTHEVLDLSSGGLSIGEVEKVPAPGKRLLLTLELPFEGFSLSLRAEAEARHYNPKTRVLGCRFAGLGQEQVSLLNYIMKSYVAGEVVRAGNVLNIAARNNFTKPRIHANTNATAPTLRRQLPGLIMAAVAGLFIVTFIAGSLYNSIFVVKAGNAAVAGPSLAVRAPVAGVYHSRLDAGLSLVRVNQVIGTVTPSSGAPTALQSPCDCYVTRTEVTDGETIPAGQRVLALIPVDAKPWIVAEIDPAQGRRIGPENTATVSVFGARDKFTGHAVSMEPALGGQGMVTMKIALDQKLPADFVNRLASVMFSVH